MGKIKVINIVAILLPFFLSENAFSDTPTCDGTLQLQGLRIKAKQPVQVRVQLKDYSSLNSINFIPTFQTFSSNMTVLNYNVTEGANFSFTLDVYADNDNTPDSPSCSFAFDYHLASGTCDIIPPITTVTASSSTNYSCMAGYPSEVTPVYGTLLQIEKNKI